MKCCKQSQSNEDDSINQGRQHSCSGLKHMLMMLLCCLAPLGVILLLKQGGYDGSANYLVLLLCPLMHLFMMRGMGHKHNESSNENKVTK